MLWEGEPLENHLVIRVMLPWLGFSVLIWRGQRVNSLSLWHVSTGLQTQRRPTPSHGQVGTLASNFQSEKYISVAHKSYCLNVYIKKSWCAGNMLSQCNSVEVKAKWEMWKWVVIKVSLASQLSLADLLSVFYLLPCYVVACQMAEPCPWSP